MLQKYIEHCKDDIIQHTQELIQIPSVHALSQDLAKPFGTAIDQALTYMLDLGKKLGFRTKNVDGYCGYIEFGEGDELVGIIGHLDVVPEGENWTFPPFSATIHDGNIYGRGAIDDKGPVISALYAMKAVMENCSVSKRVRLILGLNEERNWKCINYYKKHEELPTIGFSPDADFPCIYAEKSVVTYYLNFDLSKLNSSTIHIQAIDCHNNRINVVPRYCSTVLQIDDKKIDMKDFIECLREIINSYSFEIDIYKIDETHVKLTSYGVQAHAAHPNLGTNAISRLLIILDTIYKKYNCPIGLLDFFRTYIGDEYNGKKLGIDFQDETGRLTLNVGDFKRFKNTLKIGMNLRVPATIATSSVESQFLKATKPYEIDFETSGYSPALYLSKDNPLVQTLCQIYNDFTHSNEEPIAIGGATYARAFDNCISFGANFPGQKDMCHQTDEFISIEQLILASKIYAEAIRKLASDDLQLT